MSIDIRMVTGYGWSLLKNFLDVVDIYRDKNTDFTAFRGKNSIFLPRPQCHNKHAKIEREALSCIISESPGTGTTKRPSFWAIANTFFMIISDILFDTSVSKQWMLTSFVFSGLLKKKKKEILKLLNI